MAKIIVQELAATLRNIAYSDGQKHKLQWSLHVIHPRTNDGDAGYSGGIWCNHNFKHRTDISISFSFSESRGIHQFHMWRDRCEIRFDFIEKERKLSLEKLIEIAKKEYGIDELYKDGGK